ncbi:MAG TPA: hemerythrin domain-containing protein [Thermoleophilia bacterium]|nr:hemerythrin domain-containing protein [Thermoleophilia bacterium]HQJ97256.1 hemerythrin domain-containing protein [Thermoleophilia bacterium]
MEAIASLKREHRVMREVCKACRHELDRAGRCHVVDAAEIERFIEFFRFYTNSCHDPKEEDLLFSMLHHKGLAWDEEPLKSLCYEHDAMRAMLKAAAEWVPKARRGDQSALEPLCHDLLAYVDEIEQHMAKEESGVFVHALDVLSEADHDELTRAFENVDSEDSEEGAVEYYEGLAQDLTSYGT